MWGMVREQEFPVSSRVKRVGGKGNERKESRSEKGNQYLSTPNTHLVSSRAGLQIQDYGATAWEQKQLVDFGGGAARVGELREDRLCSPSARCQRPAKALGSSSKSELQAPSSGH